MFVKVFKLNVWRLLRLDVHDAFTNMAIDEAVLKTRVEGLVPDTLRFYCWKPSAVSVGRFQKVESEVQMENCTKQAVNVVRRITGGRTVYHDAEDEITYSVVVDKKALKANDIAEVYARIYSGLTQALMILGVTADFNEGSVRACPNLTVKGKKISGSAQCHKRGVVLQHGTILARVDLTKMFTYLRVPWAKSCMQAVSVAERKITSLRGELGRNVSATELQDALIEGFQQALRIKLVDAELTSGERELAEKIRVQKYAKPDWNINGLSND